MVRKIRVKKMEKENKGEKQIQEEYKRVRNLTFKNRASYI
jgi:hypothetical protein